MSLFDGRVRKDNAGLFTVEAADGALLCCRAATRLRNGGQGVKPGDLVLVSNRYETQMCAIDCGAQAIVVCCGSAVPRTIVARAQEKGCAVLATPYDTYAAARLISTAAPVRHFMRTKELLKFSVNTPIEDAKKVMASVRHRYFPILDENGKYCGVVSRRNLLNLHRKQVILVDHNERTQAVDGLSRRTFWRSSTITASAVWRPPARSISAMFRWVARPRFCTRCTASRA